MSKLLSVLIASVFAAAMSFNVSAAESVKAEVKADKIQGGLVTYRLAMGTAKADYEVATAACKTKPEPDQKACMKDAKAAKEKAIADAKAAKDKAVADAKADEKAVK